MNYTEQEENRKRYARGAAIDAASRNKANRGRYSPEQKAVADEIKTLIDNAYMGATTYLNLRDKFIAIKVESPGQNRFRAEVRALDKELEAKGVLIIKTKYNHFVYRLPEEV